MVTPVAGSVTSKPSSSIGDSLGRAPLNRIRPSGPRITEGSSGSDSRACSRRLGSRAMSVAVNVLPSSGAIGDSGDNVDPTTTVVVDARAIGSTMRLTSGRNTVVDSKPSSCATTCVPRAESGMTNVPSGPETMVVVTVVPSRTSMVTPGNGGRSGRRPRRASPGLTRAGVRPTRTSSATTIRSDAQV